MLVTIVSSTAPAFYIYDSYNPQGAVKTDISAAIHMQVGSSWITTFAINMFCSILTTNLLLLCQPIYYHQLSKTLVIHYTFVIAIYVMPYIFLANNIQHNLDSSKALILTHSNIFLVLRAGYRSSGYSSKLYVSLTGSSLKFIHGITIHTTMSSVTLKTLRKKRSSHGTIITILVNKIESYSTKEPLQMDVAQLDDFLSSLKKSSKDYFEAHHPIIDKCDSEQAAKEEDVLDHQEFTIDKAMSQLRVLRQMREAHSMIAELTIEVETLEQTRSDYRARFCT